MEQTCTWCDVVKPWSEFPLYKGKMLKKCRDCKRAYERRQYATSATAKSRINGRNKKVRQENKDLRLAYLLDHPCVDCGEADPIVLDFDHLGDKTDNVANMVLGAWSWERIMKEIAKCEVVCANCHRRRTHNRRTTGCGASVSPSGLDPEV